MKTLKKWLIRRPEAFCAFFFLMSVAFGAEDYSEFSESVARLARSPDWLTPEHDLLFQLSSVVGEYEKDVLGTLENGVNDREVSTLLQVISLSKEDRKLKYWFPIIADLMASFDERGLKKALVQAAEILAISDDLKYLPYIQGYIDHQDDDIGRRMKRLEKRMLEYGKEKEKGGM